MWKKIKDWYVEHKDKIAGTFIIIVTVLFVAFYIYQFFHGHLTKPVTTMPQQQAETPAGVEKAANNANIELDYGQAKQVSETIKEIRVTEKEPVYVIQTTGSEAKEVSENVVKQEKADFAIVTDKDNPEKVVELDNLDKDATVNLSQYNIKAYKNHINTVEYYPSEKTIGYTHQWKVSKSGHYMGVGVDYDTDDKKIMAKVTYSW